MHASPYGAALHALLQGFAGRKKITVMVPGHKAGSTLRFVRRLACRAEGERACEWWRSGGRDITPADLDAPIGQQDCRPCKDCRAPKVSLQEVSVTLFGSHRGELAQSERVLDSWMYGERPMNPTLFKRMVVGALAQGWLSWMQAVTAMHQVVELEATASAMRKFFYRLRRRRGADDPSIDELDRTIEAEINRVWNEMVVRGEEAALRAPFLSDAGEVHATNVPQSSVARGLR